MRLWKEPLLEGMERQQNKMKWKYWGLKSTVEKRIGLVGEMKKVNNQNERHVEITLET